MKFVRWTAEECLKALSPSRWSVSLRFSPAVTIKKSKARKDVEMDTQSVTILLAA